MAQNAMVGAGPRLPLDPMVAGVMRRPSDDEAGGVVPGGVVDEARHHHDR